MNIVILSRGPRLYSTRRLRDAFRTRGHRVRVLDTLRFSILLRQGDPGLLYNNRPLGPCEAVIPRIGASITFFGTAVVRQFEQMGIFCLNSSAAISASRDKLRSIQALSRHRIGIAETAFVKSKGAILPAIEQIGGAPVVIKLLEGTQGIGVILADEIKMAEAIVETLQSTKQNVLMQNFVSESKGRDVRAFVVGNQVVAAMRRRAKGAEFRSNVHRGGMVEAVKLDPEYERVAIHAAQILGLHVAGVDMLEADEGPSIMEVNSSPGLEGIEKATGVDVAGAIASYLEESMHFPEVDVRQRSLAHGYGVVEVSVTEGSRLAGRTLMESRLTDMDVVILSIMRGSESIPVPRGSRQVLPGDTLLCFGKLNTLRQLLPKKQTGRRRAEPS